MGDSQRGRVGQMVDGSNPAGSVNVMRLRYRLWRFLPWGNRGYSARPVNPVILTALSFCSAVALAVVTVVDGTVVLITAAPAYALIIGFASGVIVQAVQRRRRERGARTVDRAFSYQWGRISKAGL